ncbi:MAG: tyrosine-type recombinase/integrase [Proteobacteria bacterium]|nr:tyrosine-type recombinase/integrase [Pseudomonadota bacterium]
MTSDLFEVLKSQFHVTGKWPYVFMDMDSLKPFTSRQHWFARVCRRAGGEPFGFHAIRHLTASLLASKDVPMVDIQTTLRHKNLATTERYIKRIKKIRATLEVLPGLKERQPNGQPNGYVENIETAK